jgi:tetratricopeptide (TPR) repeat protein
MSARVLIAFASLLIGCSLTPGTDAVARPWVEVEGSLFTLRSDADPVSTRALAHDLERFIAIVRVAAAMTIEPPIRPLHIYAIENRDLLRRIRLDELGPNRANRGPPSPFVPIFPSKRSWRGERATRTCHGNVPTVRGTVVLAAIGGSQDRLRTILQHEMVHFLLDRNGAFVPLWYHEGLAEFLSTAYVRDDLASIGSIETMRASSLGTFDVLPVEDLMSAHDYGDQRYDVDRLHATSWLLVHAMSTEALGGIDPDQQRLRDYIVRVARGESWDIAFRASFSTPAEHFDAVLAEHLERVRAGQGRKMHLRMEDLDVADPGPARVAAHGDVAVDLAEVLFAYEQAWSTDTATGILETALAVDPDAADARAALSWAKARRFRPPAGETEIARALAETPSDPAVQLYAGRMRMVRATDGRTLDTSSLARAREHYRRAVTLDPMLSPGWSELGESYLLDGSDGAQEVGIEALEHARALRPADSSIHLALGELHARRGEIDEARFHLERVLRWSASDGEREEAQELLGRLPE